MALHRDIYWVGRQWAVTGHGMQADRPEAEGQFDIEVRRLWDENLIESLRANEWLNAEDFDKGCGARARSATRFPEPPPEAVRTAIKPIARLRRLRGGRASAMPPNRESPLDARR